MTVFTHRRQRVQPSKPLFIAFGIVLVLCGLSVLPAYALVPNMPAKPIQEAVHAAMNAGQAALLGLVEGVTEYVRSVPRAICC